jgi:hypothetical protein
MTKLVLAAALMLAAAATGARADDDDCQPGANASVMTPAALEAKAGALGYKTVRSGYDDGCFKVRAVDIDGNHVKIKLDPANGALVHLDRDDDDDNRDDD